MNLQDIQKRMEELSAEMLTLSNQMTRLIGGLRVELGIPVGKFTDLKTGDVINIPHDFKDIDGDSFVAGTYTVTCVEHPRYSGEWDIAIRAQEEHVWLNLASLTSVTKVK